MNVHGFSILALAGNRDVNFNANLWYVGRVFNVTRVLLIMRYFNRSEAWAKALEKSFYYDIAWLNLHNTEVHNLLNIWR